MRIGVSVGAALALAVSVATASCDDGVELVSAPAPPSDCAEPCELTLPQCGCPAGQMCGYNAGQLGCFNAGTVGLGEPCEGASCAAGLPCLSFIAPPGHCYAYCDQDSDCEGDGGRCHIVLNRQQDDAPARVCSVGCDLLTGAGCSGDDTKCFAFRSSDNIDFTACAPAGATALGATCTSSSECAGGQLCLQPDGATEKTCLLFCEMAASDCPMGYECASLTPTILVELTVYGACVPQ